MIERKSSREYLEESAIELLSRNTIEKISVKKICENCHLSTRTFYKYYKDKYELMNTCFHRQLERYYQLNANHISLHSFLLYTATIVCQRQAFFVNVFQYTGQNNIRLSLVEPLREQYIKIICDYFHDNMTDSLYHAITFFIKGQLSYVEEALHMRNIPDAKSSVAYFENAIPACLEKYL